MGLLHPFISKWYYVSIMMHLFNKSAGREEEEEETRFRSASLFLLANFDIVILSMAFALRFIRIQLLVIIVERVDDCCTTRKFLTQRDLRTFLSNLPSRQRSTSLLSLTDQKALVTRDFTRDLLAMKTQTIKNVSADKRACNEASFGDDWSCGGFRKKVGMK